jgi:N-acetylglucosamine-6-sulfatase
VLCPRGGACIVQTTLKAWPASLIAASSAAIVLGSLAPHAAPAKELAAHRMDRGRPNVVVIVTDDQRYDTLGAMPAVRSLLGRQGIEFTEAFVGNPLCCPSRATILTGRYSHSTGVYTNDSARHGGYAAFKHEQAKTIATALNRVGYRTGLFGKYFNGYHAEAIPIGWDRWFATFGLDGSYYRYRADDDGRIRTFGAHPEDYGTTVLRREAVRFIRRSRTGRPLFLYVTPHAPHAPAIPAPGDEDAFQDLSWDKGPAFNEADVDDKPPYIRSIPLMRRPRIAHIRSFRRQQYRSLLAVDRMVAEIIAALRDTHRLHDSLIVFTSDNGFLWGEHRFTAKDVPYEESVRVPLFVRFDRAGVSGKDAHLVGNVDLAPTIADAAGATLTGMEGRSLLPLLRGGDPSWRSALLVEHLRYPTGKRMDVPTYCMVRTDRFAFIRYGTGGRELYDLQDDPAELTNIAGDPSSAATRRHLTSRLHRLCRPPPPGFHW